MVIEPVIYPMYYLMVDEEASSIITTNLLRASEHGGSNYSCVKVLLQSKKKFFQVGHVRIQDNLDMFLSLSGSVQL